MTELKRCRVCASSSLDLVLDLGDLALTGTFPASRDETVPSAPIRLVRCSDEGGCGLVQLADSYPPEALYGESYGYRSGLNQSMVRHLASSVDRAMTSAELAPGDVVLDIGSNDGTTLGFYPSSLERWGMDPTATKFAQYYEPGVRFIPEFFSADAFLAATGGQKAAIITSFSMFYDLDDPVGFARSVESVLADRGIWMLEQSYLPAMLQTTSYDTVCHEHLEYYSLDVIDWILREAGLEAIDVEFNKVNGGSFSVMAVRSDDPRTPTAAIQQARTSERILGLRTPRPFESFRDAVMQHRSDLRRALHRAQSQGHRLAALGASTKGNVILQVCDIGEDLIELIGEVNEDKFGRFTPGSRIPIVPEHEVLTGEFDLLLILPWHFRETFGSKDYPAGSQLLIPLPHIELQHSQS